MDEKSYTGKIKSVHRYVLLLTREISKATHSTYTTRAQAIEIIVREIVVRQIMLREVVRLQRVL